ncbi:MAG: class I SAM-dependent methyltransferase [Acidimicrobiia bacterium]|nr:class I SAM-dependent methyltransferase [Acidimicrobiia bacterium]
MTDAGAAGVLRWLKEAGLEGWTPPGTYDDERGVWFTDDTVDNSFPEDGIERFGRVDDHSFWFAHRNGVILDQLERLTGRHNLFVDIGSGSGVVARYLNAAGYPVMTVEPHPAGALYAARRGTVASFCGDLASVRLPDASVRAAGAFDVVEHIEDPSSLLAEVRRVLTPDGTLLLTVPSYQWLWSDFDEWNGHVERFTQRRLAEVLAASGFRLTEHSYFFSPLVAPAYVKRVVGRRFGKARSPDEVGEDVEATLDPSSRIINRAIRSVLAGERRLMRRIRIPFGTSLLGVARPA